MKKGKGLIGIFLAVSVATNPIVSFAFSSATHSYVTECALRIIEETFGDRFAEILTPENKEIIIEYSVMPDVDENEGAFKQHFFNLMTKKNFRGETDSALTKCKTHFFKAQGFAHSGDMQMAAQELGRALHFLEDICTPVHSNNISTADAGFNVASHVAFERKCVELHKRGEKSRRESLRLEEKRASSAESLDFDSVLDEESEEMRVRGDDEESMPPEEFTFFLDNDIKRICYVSADTSAQIYESMSKRRTEVEEAARLSIRHAKKSTAGLLCNFLTTITSASGEDEGATNSRATLLRGTQDLFD